MNNLPPVTAVRSSRADTRRIRVDGRGRWACAGVVCHSSTCRAQGFLMGGHTEALDGGLCARAAYCLTRCSSLLFPKCRFHAQQCRARRPNGGPGRRNCLGVSRQGSVSAWFATGHDRGCRPHEGGLAPHPLSEGAMLLDLAAWLFNDCISILWHLTGTLSGPASVPPQYQNVFMSRPQQRPLLSQLTWGGKVRW